MTKTLESLLHLLNELDKATVNAYETGDYWMCDKFRRQIDSLGSIGAKLLCPGECDQFFHEINERMLSLEELQAE